MGIRSTRFLAMSVSTIYLRDDFDDDLRRSAQIAAYHEQLRRMAPVGDDRAPPMHKASACRPQPRARSYPPPSFGTYQGDF